MLLQSFIPHLPSTLAETWLFIVGALSIILMIYAVFMEKEYRQDLVRLVGASGLLVYALYIGNLIFTIAMGAIAVASLVEFVEIMLGLHRHSPEDLARYKTFVRTKHLKRREE